MRLKNIEYLFINGLIFSFMIIAPIIDIRGNSEFDYYLKKYPEESVILNEHNLNISFEIKKGKPMATSNRNTSYFVLSGNASDFTESKEYFSSNDLANKINAYTLIPENGKYKKIPVTSYTKTLDIDRGLFYDDSYTINFTFPSVRIGAKLVTESYYETTDMYQPFCFYFAGPIPYDKSDLTIILPLNIKINYHMEGGKDTSLIKFSKEIKGKKNIYHWQASISKSYRKDYLAPDFKYFTPHIIIQVAGYSIDNSFVPVIRSVKDYYKHCYSHIKEINTKPSVGIGTLVDSIVKKMSSNQQKVECLYKWVQNNIKYVAIEDGTNGVVPKNADEVLKNRYGDCKGKTSLLVEMIKASGLNASFAWIGTRELPYKFSTFPTSWVDDHMVAVWWDDENKPVVLDATSLYNRFFDIPALIQGKECLIAKNDTDFLLYTIPISKSENNLYFDSISVSLKNNILYGIGKLTLTGEPMINHQVTIEKIDKSKYHKIIADESIKASNKFIVDSVSIHPIENNNAPLVINYSFSLPDYVSGSGDCLYLNMNIDRFFQLLSFKETRSIPIEAEFCTLYKFICCFKIPSGYKVDHLPDIKSGKTDQFEFNQEYQLNDNTLILKSIVKINFLIIENDDLIPFRESLKTMNSNYLKTIKLIKI